MANRSAAVVNDRKAARAGLDDFPTPPWATRALMEHVLRPRYLLNLKGQTSMEPACGRGFMSSVLVEYFRRRDVSSSDAADYGYPPGKALDFLDPARRLPRVNWVITNPPFIKAEAFIERAFEIASTGVAMLVRSNFLEGTGRYERLFSKRPPTIVAYFSERVSIVPGKVDPKASQPTAYVWLVWTAAPPQPVVWIPPCRAALTRPDDHIPPAERGR